MYSISKKGKEKGKSQGRRHPHCPYSNAVLHSPTGVKECPPYIRALEIPSALSKIVMAFAQVR